MITLQYQGRKTENEIYTIVLSSIEDMMQAMGNDKEELNALFLRLDEMKATVANKLYKLSQSYIERTDIVKQLMEDAA